MMRHRADTPIYKPQVPESPMPACAGTVIRHLFISRVPLIPDLPSCSLIPLPRSLTCSPILTFSQLALLISRLFPCSLTCSSSSFLIPRPILRLPSCLTLTSSIFCDISLLCFSCALCFSNNRFSSHIPRFSRNRFFLRTDGKNQRNQNLSLCDSSFSPTVKLRTKLSESFYLENQTSTGKAGGQNYKFMK